MDRDLLRQSLGCHGPALLSLLRSEQQDNPHFRSLLGTAAEPARGAAPPPGAGRENGLKTSSGTQWVKSIAIERPDLTDFQASQGKEKRVDNIEIQKFISKKADLLFALSWKSDVSPPSEVHDDNDNLYAVMPPLEQFMEIPGMDRRELFFRDIERGDIVIGRISSIREFGFFMVLIKSLRELDIDSTCL